MKFFNIGRKAFTPPKGKAIVYLVVDRWDDFGFETQFSMVVYDEHGERFSIGKVKIGYFKQAEGENTFENIPDTFDSLDSKYFSLGQDVEYYSAIKEKIPDELSEKIMSGIQDVAYNG